MKGLVRFFAVVLALVGLYTMSFTWFVRSHENKMKARATKQVSAYMPSAKEKYPSDKELQALYDDTIGSAIRTRTQRLLDSTANQKITWWGDTYKQAKNFEAKLGLDLQGGMNVTLEVGVADLLRALSNYSRDKAFNEALTKAVEQKSTSGKDLIDLFVENYRAIAPGNKLAPLFAAGSNKKVNFESSDDAVLKYVRDEADLAFENTYKILRNRIDRFGVASPNINPDKAKKIISVELAGVTDKERVRKYLQSSANLQFFELYNITEIDESLMSAEQSLAAALKGTTDTLSATDTSMAALLANRPITALFANIMQPEQDPTTGRVVYPSAIAMVQQKDTAQLGEYLRSPLVASRMPLNLKFAFGDLGTTNDKTAGIFGLYALKTVDGFRAKLEGERIVDARQDFDERGRVAISMRMDQLGARIWAKMTEENIGKGIAIMLDDYVLSAPTVQGVIPNGNSQITGNYEVRDAIDFASTLKSGKLPAPARIVQEQVVGPTLGAEAVRGGALAFSIAFLVIFALMLGYYNNSGWIANLSLILNIFLTVAILTALGNTFTTASIAGLVLTIGMAVDTNVIIFERIKEELKWGRSYEAAVANGYRRSLSPVLDSHITTFMTAAILFYFGLGPIKGFATVQMVGIVLNLFCGILVSRTLTDWFTGRKKHLEYFTGISRKIFQHSQFRFIEFRKITYGISAIIVLLAIATLFNGFDQGVEFKGGRSYTIRFDRPMNNEEVRNELKTVFGENPIIKTVSTSNQLNITTSFMIDTPGGNVDSIVERTLFAGLKKFLPQDLTFPEFDQSYKVSSQTVLPTISEELKQGAIIATIVALFIIVAYIFIRFHDWRYSVGTIIALLHDVMVTLIVFSFLRHIVPFPLEIDQHFIAAVLTVIGFSMNDTIIVFDRIRENSGLMRTSDKTTIINKSINDTLSRTIMTSVTVILAILILFLVGSEVTRGFAFALLIGVVVGTYSSIFVAAPVLVDFARNKPLGEPESHDQSIPKKALAS
ncbi:MAG TPA: protein translocase subunit SecDF [Phnomibacter sp.]|nr:protein translocase subunit SecDF [Phnomibacter sp.]